MVHASGVGKTMWKISGIVVHLNVTCSYWSRKYRIQNFALSKTVF